MIGTNAYGPDKPIVFTIKGEVVKADEISALERITLIEGYNNSTKVKISRFGSIIILKVATKTKLFIYPETELSPVDTMCLLF